MAETESKSATRVEQGVKLRGAEKVARIPVKVIPTEKDAMPRKPEWLRVRMGSSAEVKRIKDKLRKHKLASVCEEASCPNLGECFSHGTATFMIMGDICTRRCPFCDVAHGRPNALNPDEPRELATAIADMGLRYVVITSVDRDDLRDGGAQHIADCVRETRERCETIQVETLVPDFRGRMDIALEILAATPPDVFNHNLETVPRLYKQVRPGADYEWSLDLLEGFKQRQPDIRTKSGLMVGVGETNEEIIEVMRDLREHKVDMITIGQYLQPSRSHLPVDRFVTPEEFDEFARIARELGFSHVASGPLVRSSYHADLQAKGEKVG
ncbi:lipoyl synthase [Marinobacterium nitratireducens]|uniref:Lipoyl synthase n=1 Tax=Marinobacterium nitratireducens TaxID=518897 RepID=A0A917ZBZ5_9GAMM|nr:lipoyl synthase [Marinobacterium nitratireducens]GGO78662.1 lipoyl synthase [Marinobacterium nitratireducens]